MSFLRQGVQKRFNSSLVGTVKYYKRHVVFLDGAQVNSWPAKFSLPHPSCVYIDHLKGLQNEDVKVTVAYDPTASDKVNHDVIIFPEMKRVKNIEQSDIEKLAEQCTKPIFETHLETELLPSHPHILVCAHTSRDFRCGACGPFILDNLKKIDMPCTIYASSHVGGHRYAGNIIVYPHGDWFGAIGDKRDIEELQSYFENGGEISEEHKQFWRGRIGLSKEEQKIEMERIIESSSSAWKP